VLLIFRWRTTGTSDLVVGYFAGISGINKGRTSSALRKTLMSQTHLKSEGVAQNVVEMLEGIKEQDIRGKGDFVNKLEDIIGREQTSPKSAFPAVVRNLAVPLPV
jgi:hypothetical protein